MKCIVDMADIEGIMDVVINDCYGAYFRVWEKDDVAMLYGSAYNFDFIISLSGENMPLFIELVPPLGDTIKDMITKNKKYLHVSSENKDFIQELYISNYHLNLGLTEPSRGHLSTLEDYNYINFIILNIETLRRDIVEEWKKKHPTITIYVRGISNDEHAKNCFEWGVEGVITPRYQVVNKYMSLFR